MEIVKITSHEQFEQYRKDWSDILEENCNTNPFIEFDWVNEWWRYFGEGKSVEIFVVRKNGKNIAFLPFQYRKKSLVYIYQFIGFGQANYMDIISRLSDAQEAIEYAMNDLVKSRKHIVFYLHGLLESEKTPEALQAYIRQQQFVYSSHRVITPYINLKEIKLEKYMEKRKRLHRLDRREKRLNGSADIKLDKCRLKEMDYIFHLHDKRWQKKRDTSGFTNPKERDFYKRLASIRDGALKTEVEGLYLHDKIIAFNYGFNCRGRSLSYVLGYDDDFEVFSPGRILEKEKIIQCKNGDDKIFDLSIGYETYKFDWNTGVDYTSRIIFSSTTPPAKAMRKLMSSKESLIENVKKNHRLVLFKRNEFGNFIYTAKNLYKKGARELIADTRSTVNVIKDKLYNKRKFVVYQIEKKEVPDLQGTIKFTELTLNDVVLNEEIQGKHLKTVCRKIYGGCKGYYPEGELTFNNIIWTNENVLRIDQISYLEQFKKSAIAINSWPNYDLSEVCSAIKKNSKARLLYVAVEERSKEKRAELERFGFSKVKQVNKKTVFGFDTLTTTV